MTQSDLILDHLKQGKTLTSLEALDKMNCFRLASRISTLKKEGYNIESKMIELPSGKHVAEYRLVRNQTENLGSLNCGGIARTSQQPTDELFSFKTDPLGRKIAI